MVSGSIQQVSEGVCPLRNMIGTPTRRPYHMKASYRCVLHVHGSGLLDSHDENSQTSTASRLSKGGELSVKSSARRRIADFFSLTALPNEKVLLVTSNQQRRRLQRTTVEVRHPAIQWSTLWPNYSGRTSK